MSFLTNSLTKTVVLTGAALALAAFLIARPVLAQEASSIDSIGFLESMDTTVPTTTAETVDEDLGTTSEPDILGDYKTNQILNDEQREIATLVVSRTDTLEVYAFQWPYLDTLSYYSNGQPIKAMGDNDVVNRSYYLIMYTAEHVLSRPNSKSG